MIKEVIQKSKHTTLGIVVTAIAFLATDILKNPRMLYSTYVGEAAMHFIQFALVLSGVANASKTSSLIAFCILSVFVGILGSALKHTSETKATEFQVAKIY